MPREAGNAASKEEKTLVQLKTIQTGPRGHRRDSAADERRGSKGGVRRGRGAGANYKSGGSNLSAGAWRRPPCILRLRYLRPPWRAGRFGVPAHVRRGARACNGHHRRRARRADKRRRGRGGSLCRRRSGSARHRLWRKGCAGGHCRQRPHALCAGRNGICPQSGRACHRPHLLPRLRDRYGGGCGHCAAARAGGGNGLYPAEERHGAKISAEHALHRDDDQDGQGIQQFDGGRVRQ